MTRAPRQTDWTAKTAAALDTDSAASLFSAAEREAAPLLGTIVHERYRVMRLLGEGAMGAVYLAEHLLLKKRVAIKVLHAEMSALPEVVARFEREAVAASRIDHPNVVAATDYGQLPDGSFFLALEFIEGRTLRQELDTIAAPLPLARALPIIRQIALAAGSAHAVRIVHRDLKPENVMLVERDGHPDSVKVLDFGIARVPMDEMSQPTSKPITRIGMVYGTPEYMAPEQAMGQPVDARADVYAIGIMAYEMLAGARPFATENKVRLMGMQIASAVPPIHSKQPAHSVPRDVEAYILTLLDKDAARRPANGQAVAEAIELFVERYPAGRMPSLRPPSAPPSLAPASSAPPALFVANTQRLNASNSNAPPALASAAVLGPVADAWWERLSLFRYVPRRRRGAIAALIASFGAAIAGAAVLLATGAYLNSEGSRLHGGITEVTTAMATNAIYVSKAKLLAARAREAAAAAMAPSARAAATAGDLDGSAAGANGEEYAAALALVDSGRVDEGQQKLRAIALSPAQTDRVSAALARGYFALRKPVEALSNLRRLCTSNPALVEGPILASALSAATLTPKPSKLGGDTLQLLEKCPSPAAADALYELAIQPTMAEPIRRRARAALERREMQARATPAAQVAIALRIVGASCNARDLLARARADGDLRTLPLLKALVPPAAPPHFAPDTLSCFRGERSLNDAIIAIEKRQK